MSKHPLTCLKWLQDSVHLLTLHQAASDSVVFILLALETVAAEEVEVSMEEVVAEDVEEEVYKVEEETSKEVLEGATAHMKMELTYQMSPITLKIQSGPHSKTIEVKGSMRTRYAQTSWKIKIGAPPALSVLERKTRTG